MEYIVYCDESDASGKFYGNFYGGVLVRSSYLAEVTSALTDKKVELGLTSELKWQKVSAAYLEKYEEFTDLLLTSSCRI